MKRFIFLGSILALAACEAGTTGSGVFREYMVIGNTMTFEQCRARGGLIIRDSSTLMVACDPTIRRTPVPADEFNHPESPERG